MIDGVTTKALREAATALGYNVAALDDAALVRWARELPPDTQRELVAVAARPAKEGKR